MSDLKLQFVTSSRGGARRVLSSAAQSCSIQDWLSGISGYFYALLLRNVAREFASWKVVEFNQSVGRMGEQRTVW